MATKTITLSFTKERETKGTYRYAEVVPETDEAKVGTLYVRKFALAEIGAPETVTVTISA